MTDRESITHISLPVNDRFVFFGCFFIAALFRQSGVFLSDKIKLPDVMPDRPLYVAAGQALSVHEYAVKSHPLDPVSFREAADVDLGSRHSGISWFIPMPE